MSQEDKRRERALERVREEAEAEEKAEAERARRRRRRNAAVVRAARYAPATAIAKADGRSHGFISRIIRDGGEPRSGSVIDRERRDG